jgi:pyruvate/2-oxoglutarate dehydrogenase complex dihydrolipoamide acyltransferase (E2) component
MGMLEGKIVEWLKGEGDDVEEGEPLVEVEAEKATAEVVAPVSGRLARIVVPAGETVPVRTVLALIE